MNSRRSFFKRLAQAAAIVALAPQLCFRAKPEAFELLTYRKNVVGVYEQLRMCDEWVKEHGINPPLDLDDCFKALYKLKEARAHRDFAQDFFFDS